MKNKVRTALAAVLAVAFMAAFAACGPKNGAQYTVAFDLNGGTGNFAAQTIDAGKKAVKPSGKPEKAGFEFAGWSDLASAYEEHDFDKPVNSDITVYAAWKTSGAAMLTVTFNANGGTGGTQSLQIEKGSALPSYTAPGKTGSVFLGWTTVKDDESALLSGVINGNITLYALWGDESNPKAVLNAAILWTALNLKGMEAIIEYGYGSITIAKVMLSGETLKAHSQLDVYNDDAYQSVWVNGVRYEAYYRSAEADSTFRQYNMPVFIASYKFDREEFVEPYIEITQDSTSAITTDGSDIYTVIYSGDGVNELFSNGVYYFKIINGYIVEFKYEPSAGLGIVSEIIYKFYTTVDSSFITPPELPEGAVWEQRYTVNFIYPAGAATYDNDSYHHLYGEKEFNYDYYCDTFDSDYLKPNYKFEGFYGDAAFTQEITQNFVLTQDITVYIKAIEVTE